MLIFINVLLQKTSDTPLPNQKSFNDILTIFKI